MPVGSARAANSRAGSAHGTCAGPSEIGDKTGPGCRGGELAQAAALAVAHVPRQDRVRFSGWVDQGGLHDLRELLAQWLDAAKSGGAHVQLLQFADPATRDATQLEEGFALNLASLVADRGNNAARLAAPLQLVALAEKRNITGISRAGQRPLPVPRAPASASNIEPSEKWKATMDDAQGDPRSSQYDPIIRTELNSYNRRFSGTPRFVPLDFRIFKAMLLMESSGPDRQEWSPLPFSNRQSGGCGTWGLVARGRRVRVNHDTGVA